MSDDNGVKLDNFELFKNTAETNRQDWLNNAMFVSYGIVAQVIDINTVVALPAANVNGFSQPVTLTLLRPSSALFESSVEPLVGDKVLVLSLDLKAPGMFTSDKPVTDKNAARRGIFSGVGVLLSVFRGLSATTVSHEKEGDDFRLRLESAATLYLQFGRALSAVFEALGDKEEPLRLFFGKLSPLFMEHNAAVERRHGFDVDADGKEIAVPAPATEAYSSKSPVTADYRAAVERKHGFDLDEEGEEVAVPAPVTETYSEKAPIKKDIRGPQTVKIGLDAEDNATEAPLDVTVGENADISVASASGLTLHFDKAVAFETKEGQTWNIDGDLDITVGGKVSIHSSGCVINDVLEVK
jgi:hypothetical protein